MLFPPFYLPARYFPPAYLAAMLPVSAGTPGPALPPSFFPGGYFAPGYFGAAASSAPVLPVLLSLSVSVNYTPNPSTSALQIVETGQVFGPYPDSVSANGDGTFALTIGLTALPAGLLPGLVSVQPGDVIGGVFIPAAGVGPIAGTLALADAPAPAAAPDVDFTLGAGVFSIAGQTTTAEAGSAGFLHFPVSATLDADGSVYDPMGAAVQIALTDGVDPLPSDFLPAEWQTRTACPGAGLYAVLSLAGLPLPRGRYTGYVQTAGYLLRAPGYITFE